MNDRSNGVEPQPGSQVPDSLLLKPVDGLGNPEIRYLLFLPNSYRPEGELFPLLLFLHGAGERGKHLDVVKKHGPPKIVETNREFPFIVASPQCPSNQRWSASELIQLVDHLTTTYRVDANRLYVTGLSMGGYGTWSLCMAYPERFAAAVPICGGGKTGDAHKLQSLPLWVFHGANDRIVNIQQSQEMVRAIEAAGGNVKFTIYSDGEHDSWTDTYNNPAVYDWLLQQKRKSSDQCKVVYRPAEGAGSLWSAVISKRPTTSRRLRLGGKREDSPDHKFRYGEL